jgi:hypothetical protein
MLATNDIEMRKLLKIKYIEKESTDDFVTKEWR